MIKNRLASAENSTIALPELLSSPRVQTVMEEARGSSISYDAGIINLKSTISAASKKCATTKANPKWTQSEQIVNLVNEEVRN